ncbi:RHS repeat protein, partial [Oxalobacteraceae sp. CFBP 13730]|nr:RHS repeat protein [Oxalobacteraceae sp. CFBP 13730]
MTRLDYDGVGQIKKVSLPDNSIVTYDYDDAHRLIGIGDA